MKENEENIDTDLYSRQIGTYGMKIMAKLLKMKVLIVGMRGLGVETAKNIILSGSHSVDIHDPTLVKINDLGSNFYLSEEDINKKNRDEASLLNLSQLNTSIKVSVLKINSKKNTKEYTDEFCEKIPNYNIIVFTEVQSKDFLIRVDDECRKKDVKLIYGICFGLTGAIFTDFGPKHEIIDNDGKEIKSYYIKSISKDAEGLVTIDTIQDTEKLEMGHGDIVKFKNVEGMIELNDKEFKIDLEDKKSFRIGDTTKYGDYTKGGIVFKVKKTKIIKYEDYRKRSEIMYDSNSKLYNSDFTKNGRQLLLFITFGKIQEYYASHEFTLPELNNAKQANEIVEQVKKKYEEIKNKKDSGYENLIDFNEKIVFNTIRWSSVHLCPITAFFGGILSQEIMKSTGQYIPINQWLIFDFFEVVENIKDDADRTLKNSRYDEQIAVFGNEIQQKLEKSNFFMVGAGATGCEFLKNFAMMGASSADNSKFVVTDNDNIEISNLSRQFLFKKNDVTKPKSEIAKISTKKMNPNFNVESMENKVCSETENIFNEDFWENQSFIIFAVDSVDARKYIDTKIISHEKCAIDSGTRGIMAHSQIIVPHKTNTYTDEAPNTVIKELPVCTLRLFPSKIEHCIEWARDSFKGYFVDNISETKKFFSDRQGFAQIYLEGGNLERLELIKNHIYFIVNKKLEDMVEYAMTNYINSFDYNIRSLLISFPEDYKQKNDGKNLWGSSKIRPHEIPFDYNNDSCIFYVQKFIQILSHALGIPFTNNELSKENIKNICSKIKLPEFIPQIINFDNNGNLEGNEDQNHFDEEDNENENDLENTNNTNEEEKSVNKEKIKNILQDLESINIKEFDESKINPEIFEKDHDENGHIDFVHITAILRARNYNIDECDRNKTKIISGKIIPTILTSTATVAGISSLQIYTLLQTHEPEFLRNSYFNLGINEYLFTQPNEPNYIEDEKFNIKEAKPIKVIPKGRTVWDKIEIKGSKTCGEIIEFLKKEYNVDIDMIISGEVILINTIFPSFQSKIGMKLEDIYNEKAKYKLEKNYMMINVIGEIENTEIEGEKVENASVNMPTIKYIFK